MTDESDTAAYLGERDTALLAARVAAARAAPATIYSVLGDAYHQPLAALQPRGFRGR